MNAEKMAGLDKTIESLNELLAGTGDQKLTLKEKLQVSDRLLRAYALQLKHTSEGKGGKFTEIPT